MELIPLTRFDDGARRRDAPDRDRLSGGGLFWWSVFLLLLTGLAMGTWIGTFSVFGHPERPLSYKILRRIKKLDPPQRFKVNAAPAGDFLSAEKAWARWGALSEFELRSLNVQLTRDYLRNFTQTTVAVPYFMGRLSVMDAVPLSKDDLFPSGVVVLAVAPEWPQVLVEHVFPTDANVAPLVQRVLRTGMELELKRTYDLTAVVRVTRLEDSRLVLTVVPLTYGGFALRSNGLGFQLSPPEELKLAADWPVVKEERRTGAERKYQLWRRSVSLPALLVRAKDAPPLPPALIEAARAAAVDVIASSDEVGRRSRGGLPSISTAANAAAGRGGGGEPVGGPAGAGAAAARSASHPKPAPSASPTAAPSSPAAAGGRRP